jgi:hypothetical protein
MKYLKECRECCHYPCKSQSQVRLCRREREYTRKHPDKYAAINDTMEYARKLKKNDQKIDALKLKKIEALTKIVAELKAKGFQ